MAKRVRYQIGDVFLVKLINDLMGVGRVLKKDYDTVFIELYNTAPIKQKSEFSYSVYLTASKVEPVLMIWCYDDNLKNGEWEIIENTLVTPDFQMPLFWTQDALSGEYCIVRGTDTSSGESTGIVIKKEEAMMLNPYGIISPINVSKRYFRKLQELNMMV